MSGDAYSAWPPGRFGYGGYGAPLTQSVPNAGSGAEATAAENAAGFFEALIDIVNPLQHLPVISTIYRKLTDDEISPFARVVGGGLYGGVIGLAAAAVNAAIEAESGRDLGEHALAWLEDDDTQPNADEGATRLAADGPPGAASGGGPRVMSIRPPLDDTYSK